MSNENGGCGACGDATGEGSTLSANNNSAPAERLGTGRASNKFTEPVIVPYGQELTNIPVSFRSDQVLRGISSESALQPLQDPDAHFGGGQFQSVHTIPNTLTLNAPDMPSFVRKAGSRTSTTLASLPVDMLGLIRPRPTEHMQLSMMPGVGLRVRRVDSTPGTVSDEKKITVRQKLTDLVDHWDKVARLNEAIYQSCVNRCLLVHGIGTREYSACLSDCGKHVRKASWAYRRKAAAKSELDSLAKADSDKIAEPKKLESPDWEEKGQDIFDDVVSGLEDALESDDDDAASAYAKDRSKTLATSEAKRQMKDASGFDPDEKPMCTIAAALLVAYALKEGLAATEDAKSAAARAFEALKDTSPFSSAEAACRVSGGRTNTSAEMARGWLEWAAKQ